MKGAVLIKIDSLHLKSFHFDQLFDSVHNVHIAILKLVLLMNLANEWKEVANFYPPPTVMKQTYFPDNEKQEKSNRTRMKIRFRKLNINNVNLIIVAEVPSVTPPIFESGQRCLRIVKILHHHLIMMTMVMMVITYDDDNDWHQFPLS